MKKSVLCIDLDDTLSYTASTIIKYAIKYDKEVIGGNGKFDNSKNNGDYYYFARGLSWNRENVINFFDRYYPYYLDEIKVKIDASNIMRKIHDIDVEIHILTARREKNNMVYDITFNWLNKNNIYFDKLIIDAIDKKEYIKKINAKYYIDDSIDNCRIVKEHLPFVNVYVMNTEYNKEIDVSIMRIDNLNDLYEEIVRIENE